MGASLWIKLGISVLIILAIVGIWAYVVSKEITENTDNLEENFDLWKNLQEKIDNKDDDDE